jgi:hypothetical protein
MNEPAIATFDQMLALSAHVDPFVIVALDISTAHHRLGFGLLGYRLSPSASASRWSFGSWRFGFGRAGLACTRFEGGIMKRVMGGPHHG